jgi:uncharacterized phiE125 gp8 family phage protein
MTTQLITAPAEAAVSLDEFKLHGRLDGNSDDSDLQAKLDAAHGYIESTELSRRLITSTWDLHLEQWPCGNCIKIPFGNLQSVTYIKYIDSGGTLTTWPSTNYTLARVYDPAANASSDTGAGRVVLRYNKPWPNSALEAGEPIVVRFVCGWKDAASVPAQIKSAIQLYAAHLYRNREAVTDGRSIVSIPLALALESLCAPFALGRI